MNHEPQPPTRLAVHLLRYLLCTVGFSILGYFVKGKQLGMSFGECALYSAVVFGFIVLGVIGKERWPRS